MHIDIVSDVVCPWCFIGKRRLERALAARPEIDVVIDWRPFQLNPDMPPEGMERGAYLAAKFGSPAHAQHIYGEIDRIGVQEGIAFAFDRIERTPNTIDAHRLIRFAGEEGCQDRFVELLFRRYFEDGVDIADTARLIEVAAEAGLDANSVQTDLDSGRGLDAVRLEDLQARKMGVAGVPCFIFDGRYAVSGAQAPEVFIRVLESARQTVAVK